MPAMVSPAKVNRSAVPDAMHMTDAVVPWTANPCTVEMTGAVVGMMTGPGVKAVAGRVSVTVMVMMMVVVIPGSPVIPVPRIIVDSQRCHSDRRSPVGS